MMHLEILTPDKTVFAGNINAVTVPGSKGPFTVLKNHAPIISTLDRGELSILTANNSDILYEIGEGIIEVDKNRIMVLAEIVRPAEL